MKVAFTKSSSHKLFSYPKNGRQHAEDSALPGTLFKGDKELPRADPPMN